MVTDKNKRLHVSACIVLFLYVQITTCVLQRHRIVLRFSLEDQQTTFMSPEVAVWTVL